VTTNPKLMLVHIRQEKNFFDQKNKSFSLKKVRYSKEPSAWLKNREQTLRKNAPTNVF
jgi:hypothetical protein